MHGIKTAIFIPIMCTAALLTKASAGTCPFTYSHEIQTAVVEPEVDRITSGHGADYRTDDPEIFRDDDGMVRLQFLYRGLDGDVIVVRIDPCTGSLKSSADFPAFPQLTACPPEAHAPKARGASNRTTRRRTELA